MPEPDGPPRAGLIAALVVAVATVGAVLAVTAHRAHRHIPGPVLVAAVPAPHAADPVCAALLDVLPNQVGNYRRAGIAPPAPQGAAAWQTGDGDPVVLRCGVDRPAGFAVSSPIQVVDSVQWFQVRTDDLSTWYAVDRPVYVALTLPAGSGPAPIQRLSEVIERILAAVPINP